MQGGAWKPLRSTKKAWVQVAVGAQAQWTAGHKGHLADVYAAMMRPSLFKTEVEKVVLRPAEFIEQLEHMAKLSASISSI